MRFSKIVKEASELLRDSGRISYLALQMEFDLSDKQLEALKAELINSLNRLDRSQVAGMVERVTGGRTLPLEVVEQVATKTDGVPLFVEELTKAIVESDVGRPSITIMN